MHHQPLARPASFRLMVIVGLPPVDALIVYDAE